MKEKIKGRIYQAIEEKVFPACAVGVVRKNGERIIVPAGRFTFDHSAPEINENSIFDTASITKSIPTSSLVLKLIDEGKLKAEDKLINFIPEFRNSNRENVLIKHLLTQILDYDFRLSEYKNEPPDKILKVIFTKEFKSRPGEKYFYTNATSILLGLVVERIFGEKYFLPLKEPLFKSISKKFNKSGAVENNPADPTTIFFSKAKALSSCTSP